MLSFKNINVGSIQIHTIAFISQGTQADAEIKGNDLIKSLMDDLEKRDPDGVWIWRMEPHIEQHSIKSWLWRCRCQTIPPFYPDQLPNIPFKPEGYAPRIL